MGNLFTEEMGKVPDIYTGASVRMLGVPIWGFDHLINDEGEIQWKVLGIIPIVNVAGTNITKSAAGRIAAEAEWLPSLLYREDVTWTAQGSYCAHAALLVEGDRANVEFSIDGIGQLESVKPKRWGNPEGAEYHYADFGGFIESEGTFNGYTTLNQLYIGWYFGTERFNSEGEFFRVKIDHAEFR